MATSVIGYDRELPEIPDRRPSTLATKKRVDSSMSTLSIPLSRLAAQASDFQKLYELFTANKLTFEDAAAGTQSLLDDTIHYVHDVLYSEAGAKRLGLFSNLDVVVSLSDFANLSYGILIMEQAMGKPAPVNAPPISSGRILR